MKERKRKFERNIVIVFASLNIITKKEPEEIIQTYKGIFFFKAIYLFLTQHFSVWNYNNEVSLRD